MNETLSPSEVERFRLLVSKRLGLWFDDGKLEYLAQTLARRLAEVREPAALYLGKLETSIGAPPELREVAQELTVGETYFFRHTDQFRAYAEIALPARCAARSGAKQLRLLSAGCSSGEEAYSLSILAQQYLQGARWGVTIRGVDINRRALERARAARYSSWALRETPEDVRAHYFAVDGRDFVLAQTIRESVSFEEANLVGDDTWPAESYDVVFCRNVLMYFSAEVAIGVVKRFFDALAPGGFLFLGHAENLRGLSTDFDLCHTHGTFYYRKKDGFARPTPPLNLSAPPAVSPVRPEVVDWTSTWLETVQRSSDRIRALTERAPSVERGTVVRAPRDLTAALELLAHERFGEALAALSDLPPSCAEDPETLLLRAALLTHSGEVLAAERVCRELLELNGLSAGAHYLLALCKERQGDAAAAVDHSQTASYLKPAFAMPHLHLGLMARRSGERETAQRELSHAAVLLRQEDSSCLLLFGGGFGRDGLIELCRSELSRLTGGA